MTITVVVPVYGYKSSLQPLITRLEKALHGLVPTHEILLIEDGCPDHSWGEIEELVKNIHLLKESNFPEILANMRQLQLV